MRNARHTELHDRRGTAAEAKAALLEAYRAANKAAEPLREARQQERIEIAEAREARRALREQARLDEQARLAAEIRDRDAAIAAEAEAREQADNRRIARVLDDEAMRKAMRDQRYANRKARRG